MATFDKVRDIVVDQLGVEADEVNIDSTFIDDLGADSLDIVELIMAFEEEFEVEIPDKINNFSVSLEKSRGYSTGLSKDNRRKADWRSYF